MKEEKKIEEEKVTEEVKPEKKKDKKNDELKKLAEDNIKLVEEVNRLKNEYAKAYADTENLKKRLSAEAESTRKYRIQSFATEILPVIDNLERALSVEAPEDAKGFYDGVRMIYDQLVIALKNEGVNEIECLNKPFDPNFHQAIMMEKKEGVEPGMVIEVLQKGYVLKDRILRASMVKVSE